MKKITLMILFSACIIFSILLSEYIINKNFIIVKTIDVSKQNITQHIEASGTVTEQNKRELFVDFPLKVKKIYVSVGDEVKKGQKLLEFDKSIFLNKIDISLITDKNINELDNIKAAVLNYPSEITSPISGIITTINCYETKDVEIDKPIVIISDLENLIIKAAIPENLISDIYEKQEALITGSSFKNEITGQVTKIYPTAEKNELFKNNQTYIIVDVKPFSFTELKPGVNVDLRFVKKSKDDTIVIPFDCVMFEDEKAYVYLNKYGYAVKRFIKLGEEFKTNVEVIGGLEPDDKVILSPKSKNIRNGDKLSIAE